MTIPKYSGLHICPQGHIRIRIKIKINAHNVIFERIFIYKNRGSTIYLSKITIIAYKFVANNYKCSKCYQLFSTPLTYIPTAHNYLQLLSTAN